MATPYVSLNHIDGYETMSALAQYNRAIKEIATNAPIRICQHERISGTATLGDAVRHKLPADFQNQPRGFGTAVSHLTIDFETVLKKGVSYIADAKLLKQAQEHPEDYQKLSVRILGWNARFVTLDRLWQDMIIAQTGSEI